MPKSMRLLQTMLFPGYLTTHTYTHTTAHCKRHQFHVKLQLLSQPVATMTCNKQDLTFKNGFLFWDIAGTDYVLYLLLKVSNLNWNILYGHFESKERWFTSDLENKLKETLKQTNVLHDRENISRRVLLIRMKLFNIYKLHH